MQKILSKIGAGFLGAVMVGSTLLAPAMAADLSNYPAPFITDGTTNMLMVVGADASPADVVGAINVAVRLGAEPSETKTVATSGSTQSILEGVDLGLSGDLIYLEDSFSKDTLTKSDMPTVLADGTFTDDDGTNYPYTQSAVLGSTATFNYVKYNSDEDPALVIDLQGTGSSAPLYTLKATFSKTVNLTSSKSEGEAITLFGQDYTIASDTDSTKLVLYGSSEAVTLNKDEETTVTVGGTSYTIKVVGFNSDESKVILNIGGSTNSVAEGASKKIGGLQVYAKTVTSWDNGNAGIAILQLGSEKLTFEDGSAVQTGDDNDDIEGTHVTLSSTTATSTLEVAVYKPDSDSDYIKVGSDFEDPVFGAFKISFAGVSSELTADTRDQIKLRTSGDKKAYMTATDKNGNTKDVYVSYLNATNDTQLLDDNQKTIAVVENTSVAKDEYTFIAPADPKYTHMVKVKKIYARASNGYVEFRDVFSGTTYKSQIGNFNDTGETLDLVVDGKTYVVTLTNGTSDSEQVAVAYDDGKTVVYPAIELKNGEQIALTEDVTFTNLATGSLIALPTETLNLTTNSTINTTAGSAVSEVIYNTTATPVNESTANVTISVDANQVAGGAGLDDAAILVIEEQDRANKEHAIVVPIKDRDTNGDYISYDTPVFTPAQSKTVNVPTETDNVVHYVDYYGTFVEKDGTDTHHTVDTIYYPDEQMYAVIGAGTNVTVGGGTGSVTYKQVVPIKDNIARLDTDAEVESAKGNKNMILVGGPAVNRLTAAVLNLSYPTYGVDSTVPENAAMIKVVENAFGGGKIAYVVAGWEAPNTQAACSVLQQYDDYSALTGTGVEVTGTATPFEVTALE